MKQPNLTVSKLTYQSILAVDDELDNLQVLKATLEVLHGATVKVAGGVEEALRLLETFQPTMIVTDISMPKLDGHYLLKELRNRPSTTNLPIIALTAHAMIGDKEHILSAGFDGYVSKPFDIRKIGTNLLYWLDKFDLVHSDVAKR